MKDLMKNFIEGFIDTTQHKIKTLVNYQLTNEEKKARLDEYLTKYVNTMIETLGLNFVFKFVRISHK